MSEPNIKEEEEEKEEHVMFLQKCKSVLYKSVFSVLPRCLRFGDSCQMFKDSLPILVKDAIWELLEVLLFIWFI